MAALSAATLGLTLAGCSTPAASTTGGAAAAGTTAAGSAAAAPATGGTAEVTLKLGVVGGIYEDLWQPAKDKLKGEGVNLEIVQFSDYVTPNNALNSGDIDLNAFQHQIFLDTEVKQNGYKIEPIGYIFIIPLNIYSKKVKNLADLKDGDTIAIPDDVTNGGRAIKILEAAGLIKLKAGSGFNPTLKDIETYNKAIQIKELKANTIPSVLEDVTAAIINGNFALDFGLKTSDAIFKDTVLNETKYWNLIAARSQDLKDPAKVSAFKKVVAAFQSDATEKVYNDTFGGFFIKVGWDKNLLADK